MLNASTYRAPAHGAVEKRAQLFLHLKRVHPVVRRARGVLRCAADERAILHARHVVRIGAREETSRPLLRIQPLERAARDHLVAQLVVFVLRSVHPVDAVGLAERGHFFHPSEKVDVFAERLGGVGFGMVGVRCAGCVMPARARRRTPDPRPVRRFTNTTRGILQTIARRDARHDPPHAPQILDGIAADLNLDRATAPLLPSANPKRSGNHG